MKTLSGLALSDIEGVVEEINRLQDTAVCGDLELKRLTRRATVIKDKVSLDYGFALLGMIATLEGDAEKMKSCFDRAVQQSGGRAEHLFNYSMSLKYFNLYEEAYKMADAAYRKDRTDLRFLDNLIETACVLNELDDFRKYIRLWNDLTKRKHHLEYEPLVVFESARDYRGFVAENPGLELHGNRPKFIGECLEKLAEAFGIPCVIVVNVMPDEEWKPSLVAWVQWHGDCEDGIERYFKFEEWYVEKGLDQETDSIHFSIEFPEEKCDSIGRSISR